MLLALNGDTSVALGQRQGHQFGFSITAAERVEWAEEEERVKPEAGRAAAGYCWTTSGRVRPSKHFSPIP